MLYLLLLSLLLLSLSPLCSAAAPHTNSPPHSIAETITVQRSIPATRIAPGLRGPDVKPISCDYVFHQGIITSVPPSSHREAFSQPASVILLILLLCSTVHSSTCRSSSFFIFIFLASLYLLPQSTPIHPAPSSQSIVHHAPLNPPPSPPCDRHPRSRPLALHPLPSACTKTRLCHGHRDKSSAPQPC